MPTNKVINITATQHQIDDQGALPGWGERYHDLQVDVVDAINSISGASDISEKTFDLTPGASNTEILGMLFDLTEYAVTSAFMAVLDFTVKKVHSGGTLVESGSIACTYDGTNFDFSIESLGDDALVDLSFNGSGQGLYTDTSAGAHTGITNFFIRFKARSVSNL